VITEKQNCSCSLGRPILMPLRGSDCNFVSVIPVFLRTSSVLKALLAACRHRRPSGFAGLAQLAQLEWDSANFA